MASANVRAQGGSRVRQVDDNDFAHCRSSSMTVSEVLKGVVTVVTVNEVSHKDGAY